MDLGLRFKLSWVYYSNYYPTLCYAFCQSFRQSNINQVYLTTRQVDC